MINQDILRSLKQFEKHRAVKYLKLSMMHKVSFSVIFFLLLPTVIISFFRDKMRNEKIFILEYTNAEPYGTIYTRLKKDTNCTFLLLPRYYVPRLPWIFVKDMGHILLHKPMFMFENIYFLGALALRVAKYNALIEKEGIVNLLVMQEYSFYMSYITRLIEHKNGNLYNLQHGMPGETYCFFRFTKCFVWGDFYKEEYIRNGAEPSQFVVVGSVFHDSIKVKNNDETIDILYVMQGNVRGKKDTVDILTLLENLSSTYRVRILQHPRHRISVSQKLVEFDGEIIDAIVSSKLVLSRYSTALLDAQYLGKCSLAYIGEDVKLKRYLTYLDDNYIVQDISKLGEQIISVQSERDICVLQEKYISQSKSPVEAILAEVNTIRKI